VAPARRTPPEGLLEEGDEAGMPPGFPPRRRKIALRSEKGLVAFTLMLPALAAWLAGGLRVPARAPALLPFAVLAAAALAISASHLGRPVRAWRAILGLRTSRLSREVGAAGAFVTLGTLALALPQARAAIGPAAVVAALFLVVAIDAVYLAVPRETGPRLHGAETTTAFLLLAGIAADLLLLAATAAAIKAALMAARWRAGALGLRPWPGALRAALLAAAPLAAAGSWPWTVGFLFALASEALDRAAFYDALEPSSPASRMEAETRTALEAPA
jgi:DMSO reductase anchor subunit